MAGRMVALLASAFGEGSKDFQVEFWNPAAPGFEYPEDIMNLTHLEGRDDFGVAFAGGGFRGMALAHGAFRALHEAGIMDRAKYMTTSSGSAWFGVPLYFQTQDDLGQFLGKSMDPEELTAEALVGESAGTYITRLGKPMFSQYPKGFKPQEVEVAEERNATWSFLSTLQAEAQARGWPYPILSLIEKIFGSVEHLLEIIVSCGWNGICSCVFDTVGMFLLPDSVIEEFWTILTESGMKAYDLVDGGSTWCHPSQLDATRAKLGSKTRIYESQDVKHNLPFLISQASVVYFDSGTKKTPLIAAPYETSLLYSGVPVSPTVPGVYVEPFATSSKVQAAVPVNATRGAVAASRELNVLNSGGLSEWASYSTAVVAAWQIRPTLDYLAQEIHCGKTRAEKLAPRNWFWSPSGPFTKKGVPKSKQMPLGDGGVYDDIGHLPLLRRKVKKLLLFDSSAIPPDTADLPGPEKVTLEANVYLKAAFGQPGGLDPPNPAGSPNPVMAENYLTVFEPSEFAPLWETLQALKKASKPMVYRGTFSVVDNPHFGIEGGWKVDITWVVFAPVDEFFQALPEEVQTQLLKKDYFPNYGAGDPTSHFELSAISQYASWVTKGTAIPEVRNMLLSDKEPAIV